jgi:hypothetical protein
MKTTIMAAPHIAAIDLNQPGTYLHWSIFEISVANLVVIAVMVVIFGAALLLPFPRVRPLPPTPGEVPPDAAPHGEWAANLGDAAALPPGASPSACARGATRRRATG